MDEPPTSSVPGPPPSFPWQKQTDDRTVKASEGFHAHFDCFSGAAGDMMLAACLDAAGNDEDRDALLAYVTRCLRGGLPEIRDDFGIEIERVWRGMGSIAGLHVHVTSSFNHEAAPVPKRASETEVDHDGSHDDKNNEKRIETGHDHSHDHEHSHGHVHGHEHGDKHKHSHEHSHEHSHSHHNERSHHHGKPHSHAHSGKHQHEHGRKEPLPKDGIELVGVEKSGEATKLASAKETVQGSHESIDPHAEKSDERDKRNHTHDHGHVHDHSHDHSHGHSHGHGHAHAHGHSHSSPRGPLRNLPQIRKMLLDAPDECIHPWVKSTAISAFSTLADAEARTHGAATADAVHFHEVGAIDSIVDTVGTLVALRALGVNTASCSRLPLGEGTVWTDHGLLPVPAPATLRLMVGMPTCPGPPGTTGELVTPTGAALLRTLVNDHGLSPDKPNLAGRAPHMTIQTIGIGAGTKNFHKHANILRLLIGKASDGKV